MGDWAHLKTTRQFQAVFRHGQSKANGQLVVYVMKAPGGESARVGYSVSRKFGNAVRRNRVKRLMREAFRQLSARIDGTYHLVFIPRRSLAYRGLGLADVLPAMEAVLQAAGILTQARQPGAAASGGEQEG